MRVEFSLNPSAIYTKWCAQTFPPTFGLFAIFDRNFAKIVAPPNDVYENYVVCLKEQSIVRNAEPARVVRSSTNFQ